MPSTTLDLHQPILSISILGTFEVRLYGETISHFYFERVRALLGYLAVEAETTHDRTALSALLWPDSSSKKALENLRQALVVLRRVLTAQEQVTPFLLITAKTIRINPDSSYELDYTSFVQTLQHIQYHPHRRLSACSSCINQLIYATTLYRDDFFANVAVHSDLFEAWARGKRQRLHQQVVQALAELVEYFLQRGEYSEATKLAQRWVELDSFCDRANHQLVYALAENQRRHEALAHYNQYAQLIFEELRVKPPLHTQELYDQLRCGTWQTEPIQLNQHCLPGEITPFIGYEMELAHLIKLLATSHCRLITITGPIGIGKSRMALRVAWSEQQNFRDGIHFIDLEHVAAEHLPRAIVANLLPMMQDEADPRQLLPMWLQAKEILLILDNFDHLVSQGPWLTQLLQQVPQLTILVTSRRWLKVWGETLLILEGLECPSETELTTIEQYAAVQLFLETVRRRLPNFSLTTNEEWANLSTLCRMVGGIPLALELVASWSGLLSPAGLVSRVSGGLKLHSSPFHHTEGGRRNIASDFMLSLRRLSVIEQQVYWRLCVFCSSFTLKAAQAIAGATPAILMVLQSKSLLHTITAGNPGRIKSQIEPQSMAQRYQIAPVMRMFARDVLQHSMRQDTSNYEAHHNRYYFALLQEHVAELEDPHCVAAMETLRAEIKNIEHAWESSLLHNDYQQIAQAQYHLVTYYYAESDVTRAKQVLDEAVWCLANAGNLLQLER